MAERLCQVPHNRPTRGFDRIDDVLAADYHRHINEKRNQLRIKALKQIPTMEKLMRKFIFAATATIILAAPFASAASAEEVIVKERPNTVVKERVGPPEAVVRERVAPPEVVVRDRAPEVKEKVIINR